MRVPSLLPGDVPRPGSGTDLYIAKKIGGEPGDSPPNPRLRPDFESMLKNKIDGWLAGAGTDQQRTLAPMVGGVLDEDGKFDVQKLPDSAKRDLAKLQGAAEGIEAIFVKQLLGQMRQVSFGSESKGPMANFAKDMMDQALAEQAAKGRSSVGIAKLVFLDSAEHIVRAAIAKAHASNSENKS